MSASGGVLEGRHGQESPRNGLEGAARSLGALGALRDAPELVLLDPTRRSRLRWSQAWR